MNNKRECTIILQGETPSKKNSRINTRSGRSFPSKRYVKWHNDAIEQICKQQMTGKILSIGNDKQAKLTAVFYHGDYKRRDSDNQLSSILDTLVDAGVLVDDCWSVIPEKHIFDIFDKGNARCVITLVLMD